MGDNTFLQMMLRLFQSCAETQHGTDEEFPTGASSGIEGTTSPRSNAYKGNTDVTFGSLCA